MNAIDTGIYNKMKGNAPLLAGVTGIYNMKAPEGTVWTTKPYITFLNVDGGRDNAFSETFTDALYQIDIWAASNTAAGTVFDLLVTALDWQTLTISGYTSVYCRLENWQKLQDPESDVCRIMTEFRVYAQS